MKKNASVPFWFVVPALSAYTFIRIIPMGRAFFYSLTNYDGFNRNYRLVGLDNFIRLVGDERFHNSLWVSIRFLVMIVIAINVAAVLLAVLIDSAPTIAGSVTKSAIFLPLMMSQVAIAFLWASFFAYDGLFDRVLLALGSADLRIGWLTDPDIALRSTAAVEVWRALGFHTVIIYSALQTIPRELYEAARIDGAAPRSVFLRITLPLILPGLSVSVMFSTLGGLQQYAIVKVLTDGGPLGATETISYYIMSRAFDSNQQGYASAVAVVLFVMIAVITMAQNRFFSARRGEG